MGAIQAGDRGGGFNLPAMKMPSAQSLPSKAFGFVASLGFTQAVGLSGLTVLAVKNLVNTIALEILSIKKSNINDPHASSGHGYDTRDVSSGDNALRIKYQQKIDAIHVSRKEDAQSAKAMATLLIPGAGAQLAYHNGLVDTLSRGVRDVCTVLGLDRSKDLAGMIRDQAYPLNGGKIPWGDPQARFEKAVEERFPVITSEKKQRIENELTSPAVSEAIITLLEAEEKGEKDIGKRQEMILDRETRIKDKKDEYRVKAFSDFCMTLEGERGVNALVKQAEQTLLTENHQVLLNGLAGAVDIKIATPDKRVIEGTYAPGKDKEGNPTPKEGPTAMLFHGNGMTREDMLPIAKFYQDRGINVVMITMGGYADSAPGTVTNEASTYNDAQGTVNYLRDKMGLKNENILAHGLSIGGSLACFAGKNNPGVHVVADKSFTTFREAGINLTLNNVEQNTGIRGLRYFKNTSKVLVGGIIQKFFPNGLAIASLNAKTDGLNNKQKVGQIQGAFFAIAAEQDAVMGWNRDAQGNQDQNFGDRLGKAYREGQIASGNKYASVDPNEMICTTPGAHTSSFTDDGGAVEALTRHLNRVGFIKPGDLYQRDLAPLPNPAEPILKSLENWRKFGNTQIAAYRENGMPSADITWLNNGNTQIQQAIVELQGLSKKANNQDQVKIKEFISELKSELKMRNAFLKEADALVAIKLQNEMVQAQAAEQA